MPLDFSTPLGAALTIVVEDSITRDYLQAVWKDPPEMAFVLDGGNDGVRAIVRSFADEGYPTVFGITDRDYRPSNRADWENPNKEFRTFILPAHEIENYLLDAAALRANRFHDRALTVEAIEPRMARKADGLCWWAACRSTIAEWKRRFRDPFIPDPSQAITTEEAARDHVCKSNWFQTLPDELARSHIPDIYQQLARDYRRATEQVRDGSWRWEFSGKEILRDVAGEFCHRPTIVIFPKTDQEFYSDLAKKIGEWQANNQAVPNELVTLRRAILARVGL